MYCITFFGESSINFGAEGSKTDVEKYSNTIYDSIVSKAEEKTHIQKYIFYKKAFEKFSGEMKEKYPNNNFVLGIISNVGKKLSKNMVSLSGQNDRDGEK